MNWKVFAGLGLAFILLTLLCTVGQMTWIGDEAAPLMIALNPFEYGATPWLSALGDMVMFRYTFFEGPWILVRWILFLPVSLGAMVGLAITLMQGITSAIGGLFRAIRPM